MKSFSVWILVFFFNLFISPPVFAETDTRWEWGTSHSRSGPAAVVILVHGLNTSPDKMKSLGRFFQSRYDTLNVTLSGHGGSVETFRHVSRTQWQQDLYQAYRVAARRAQELRVPIYFCGYSLGGVVGVDLLTNPEYPEVHFEKMFLIAPAIAFNARSYLVKFFNIFGEGFVLKSLNVRAYRANVSGTSMAAYNALFASATALRARSSAKAHVPTLVVVDPRDELVSARGIARWIRREGLSEWRIELLNNNQSTLERHYHHLMIDAPSMGEENWQKLRGLFLEFVAS